MAKKIGNTDARTKVSCLMVTANRANLARRAVQCFLRQDYPNKELVVVDDGKQDYSPLFRDIPLSDVNYVKIQRNDDAVLGTLRNLALEHATGDYLVQWDDDDWYHPDRISIQAACLDEGYDACCLSASLMHLDNEEFIFHPYIGFLPDGVPGSIMHRRSDIIRYPGFRRAEDTLYLQQWMKLRYQKISDEYAGLFIRCFHGKNTWEEGHFKRRIRNTPKSWLQFLYHKYLRGDLSGHPRFKLNPHIRSSFEQYMEDSLTLNLFTSLQSRQ